MKFTLSYRGLLFPCLQMTTRSSLYFSKPFLCLIEPYQPQSAKHLALLVRCQCFQESHLDGQLFLTNTSVCLEGCLLAKFPKTSNLSKV